VRLHHAAILIAVALGGCGGGDPLTHDEFVSRADEICDEFNRELTDVLAEISETSSDAEIEDAIRQSIDDYEEMTDKITDLEPPENDRSIQRFVDRLERNARGLRKGADEDALMTEDFSNASNNSTMEARSLAQAAGMNDCSELGV
jgi:hypothetical protein